MVVVLVLGLPQAETMEKVTAMAMKPLNLSLPKVVILSNTKLGEHINENAF
ncbi:hypothetical protein [Peptostreptococcus porci]|uniref:hypothetical protein n=1 Tax=Peptostreptococcus porci TaxID=2652282 RepID=UPI002A83B5A4|nr:hypothetical protein [Peptostreptococcus porci]